MAYKGKHEAPAKSSPAPRRSGGSHSAPGSSHSAPRKAQAEPRSAYKAAPQRQSREYSAPPVHKTAYKAPKKKKKGIGLRGIIHILAIVGMLIVGFLIVRHVWQDIRSDKLNEELVSAAVEKVEQPSAKVSATPTPSAKASATPAPSASPTPTPEPTPEPTPTPEVAPIKVDFNKLKGQNKDIIAWLYCEDTPINYAVVQRDDDNEYYLDHLFSGEKNEKGTVFADKRNKTPFEEWNTVLYGHNMKDDSMFGLIDEYGEQEFYEAHPVMYLLTPDKDYKIEICSAFITGLESTSFEFPRTEGNPEKTIDDISRYSYIETGLIPTTEDRLVSFSTCYEELDHRYVVIGILRDLERIEQ